MLNAKTTTDLHLHTYYSDGTSSPREAILWAKNRGCDLVAITDHDGIQGLAEGREAAKELGVDFVTGIEFSTEHAGIEEIHILGYGFDENNAELLTVCEDLAGRRKTRNLRFVDVFEKQGIHVTWEELLEENGHSYVGKPVFARIFKKRGLISDISEVFKPGQYFESEEARAVPKYCLDTLEAIDLIHRAGGKAVFAHPGKVKKIGVRGSEEFYENFKRLFSECMDHGIDGIEAYHRDHTPEEEKWFADFAKREGLLVTRGSDYHGR